MKALLLISVCLLTAVPAHASNDYIGVGVCREHRYGNVWWLNCFMYKNASTPTVYPKWSGRCDEQYPNIKHAGYYDYDELQWTWLSTTVTYDTLKIHIDANCPEGTYLWNAYTIGKKANGNTDLLFKDEQQPFSSTC
jgi:hypothetical protein